MKSFRVYIAPGRVPTAAGWCAVVLSLAVILIGLFQPQFWMRHVLADQTHLVKWALVSSGLITFGLVGGLFKLFGKSLSKLETEE